VEDRGSKTVQESMIRTPLRILPLFAVLALGGCERMGITWSTSPTAQGNLQLCRQFVTHMNDLEPCLGLSYDAANYCEGVEQQDADMSGFYACLESNTSCEDGAPRMTVDQCSPPVVSRIASPADPSSDAVR